ncbi:MAG TPA: hypothetical protein DCY46_04775 [Lactobacillus sp.]|nr:hypothetical protein [Lactobacillus sp.]
MGVKKRVLVIVGLVVGVLVLAFAIWEPPVTVRFTYTVQQTRSPELDRVLRRQAVHIIQDGSRTPELPIDARQQAAVAQQLMGSYRYIAATSAPLFDAFRAGQTTIRYQRTSRLVTPGQPTNGTYLKKGDTLFGGAVGSATATENGYYTLHVRTTRQHVQSAVLGHPRGAGRNEWVTIAADPFSTVVATDAYLQRMDH